MDRRAPPPFPNTPDYINHSSKVLEYITQPGKTLPKELVSPRYRAYPPLEMFSFPQSPISQDGTPGQQQPIPTPRSRPGFLRRADSLVSSTELALFRRVHEAQQEALQESQYRQQVGNLSRAHLRPIMAISRINSLWWSTSTVSWVRNGTAHSIVIGKKKRSPEALL